MSHKIFDNAEAKRRFMDLYEMLGTEIMRNKFGQVVRNMADDKVTSLDDLPTYYLTVSDVNKAYEQLPAND